MRNTPSTQLTLWEQEGQRLAPKLDHIFAAIVASTDVDQAASVAIGIARAQGAQRRVAIADLVGECPPLEALNQSDDPHGISDSFLYGVSLNKIAKQVNDSGSVFLMPSGTEAVAMESVYANDRWRRLAAGFHQVGALLLIVAVPGTPGFAELCDHVGHLIPVGEKRFSMPLGVPVIAAQIPSPSRSQSPQPPGQPSLPPQGGGAPSILLTPPREKVVRAREAAVETTGSRNRKIGATVFVLAAIGMLIGIQWGRIAPYLPAPIAGLLERPATDTTNMLVKPTPMDTVPQADSAVPDSSAAVIDGALSSAQSDAPRVAGPVPAIANPADSASAAQFAIFYSSANTRREALPDEQLKSLKALAVTPVMLDGAEWIRVFIGASETRAGADALLAELRAAKIVNGGSVASVPFALRLEGGVPATAVSTRIASYSQRGILAYALQQANGSMTLFSGAFESPAQATTLADSLRALGMTPVLAYRTGRAF